MIIALKKKAFIAIKKVGVIYAFNVLPNRRQKVTDCGCWKVYASRCSNFVERFCSAIGNSADIVNYFEFRVKSSSICNESLQQSARDIQISVQLENGRILHAVAYESEFSSHFLRVSDLQFIYYTYCCCCYYQNKSSARRSIGSQKSPSS